MTAETVFWIAAAVIIYTFAGYPLALLALGGFIHRPVQKARIAPRVSLLIPAYNEARVIARKLENSLALDYPADRMEIVVVSDGSEDETVEIARRVKRCRVLALPENRGKAAALNAAVPQLNGEIAVFTDASALLPSDALWRLVDNFADTEVGAVCGRYTTIRPDDVNIGSSEELYWSYEAFLKTQESRLASTLGSHGHLHAIRKELYPFPPARTINDDYVIPLAAIARGFRAVYEPAARVFEEAREMTGYARRVRIMAGNIQQLRYLFQFLHPFRPLLLFFFVSHKVTRLLLPFAMAAALMANTWVVLQSRTGAATAILLAQLLFYGLALCGARLRPPALRLPFYFCMVNSAAVLALYRAIMRQKVAWK